MIVELTEQDIEIIVRALNSIGVTGADTMRAVLGLIEKIERKVSVGIT